ncbi:hypothetical protein HHK36_027655 [Tetracentron sinense]|uniref:Uncharacterized protein n=1 Tax=Tetracentron sinense TaxID=13715 RepID=A0A835D1F5_TETSI|nr:hypothetical protein HHK36_027655 [Tetracentron sinense]
MGHHSCCNQQKVKRGLWSPEEDEKLVRYITTRGYGCWSEVPEKAGLQRCGKSCRLRWINYLRPDIRRGRFTPEEEKLIISLHGVVGNRFSTISPVIRKPSAPPATVPLSVEFAQLGFGSNELDLLNQDLITTKSSFQEALFTSPSPIFMFDTGLVDGNAQTEYFHEGAGINSDSWHLNQHQVQAFPPPPPSFTAAMDSNNYLPPLIENMENMVPMQVQSCSMDEDGEKTMECLQRQELSEWVESQLCPSFLIWENVERQLGGEEIAPASSDMETMLSSYPSSL